MISMPIWDTFEFILGQFSWVFPIIGILAAFTAFAGFMRAIEGIGDSSQAEIVENSGVWIEPARKDNKCSYCGSHLILDAYWNCSRCGGPVVRAGEK